MIKEQFLSTLYERLEGLPADERDAAMQYYREYFDDAGEANEQRVLDELGAPETIAEGIRRDWGLNMPVPAPAAATAGEQVAPKPKSGLPAWLIVLLIIAAAPLFFPLLIALFSVMIGILAAIIGLAAGLVGAMVGLIVGGVALVVLGLAGLFTSPALGLASMAGGLLSTALGLLALMLCAWLCTVAAAFFKWLVRICSWPSKKKRGVVQ